MACKRTLVVVATCCLLLAGSIAVRAASICLPPSPLPTVPGADAQSVSFTGPTSAVSYSAIFWREPCAANTQVSALFLRVSPLPGDTVRLGTLFVIQNAVQRNAYAYLASDDIPKSPYNGVIAAPTTFLIESPPELTGSPAFDPNLPTTLVIYFGPSASLPAYRNGAQDASAPSIPGSLSATVVNASAVALAWSPSSDSGGSGLAGYRIERCSGASCARFAQIGIVSTNTFVDYGLNANTPYTYRVRAYDNAGNYSGYSGLSSATTFAAADRVMSIATEFYHPGFDHYFITANAAETASLISGGVPPWIPTGNTFWVWTGAHTDITSVCRFFSTAFAPKSAHFYSNDPLECTSLQSGQTWTLEDAAAFYAVSSPTGSCQTGTTPLYRLYNDGQGGAPNHRYTIDPSIRRSMMAAGWIAEGNGPDRAFACVPDDGSVGYQQTAQLLGGTWKFEFTRNGIAAADTFTFTAVRSKVESWEPWAADGTNQDGWSISAFYSTALRNFVLSSPINASGLTTFPQDDFEFSYVDDHSVTGCYHYHASFSSGIGGPCVPFTGARTASSRGQLQQR